MYHGEENSPATPFGNQTRDFSVMSPALWGEGGDRQTDRQTDRDTETQSHRDRETETKLELENFILREL